MDQWEFTTVNTSNMNWERTMAYLGSYGLQGWMIAAIDNGSFIMQRRKPQ